MRGGGGHALWISRATTVAVRCSLGVVVANATACRAPSPDLSLVVLVVVDGLRADLLERYDPLLTGGLRRLRDEGMRFPKATVDHAITVSHAGHVTIATGRHPAHHGIVDAAYYTPSPRGPRVLTDAVEDSNAAIVGAAGQRGASPRQVLVPGIAEWIQAQHPDSRAVAVGSGTYASLLHVFHPGAYVYWFDRALGRFVTSTYYRRQDPNWVERFNLEVLPAARDTARSWSPLLDPWPIDLGHPDAAPYEADGRHTAFPHRYEDEVPAADRSDAAVWSWFANTPFLDRATLELAGEAAQALRLGRRGTMDYLAVVVSEVDGIGHWYGPSSHEELDALVRVDRWLGAFFADLDRQLGRGNYLVALTSDHGMPTIPESGIDTPPGGRRLSAALVQHVLDNVSTLTEHGVDAAVRSYVRGLPYVAAVYGQPELTAVPTDSFVRLYQHSFRADRVPRLPIFSLDDGSSAIGAAGLMVRLNRGVMIDLDRAIHGSPYGYDRQVPFLVMGPGVPHGTSTDAARTVDVAPTLASLAGVQVPVGVDGRPLVRREQGDGR